MIEAVSLKETTAANRFICALVGREKSGKSRLSATARKPILTIDADARRESLAGIDGVYAITLRDPIWPAMPEAISQILDIVASLEKSRRFKDIMVGGKLVFPDAPDTLIVRTLVDDSIASIAKMAMTFALYNNKDLRRTVSIGGKLEVHTPYSYDGWGAEMNMVESIIMRQLAIKDLDVIAIMHESEEEAADSTDKNPKFTGKITVFPVRYARMLRYFNEVWRVQRTGEIPRVKVVPEDMYGGFIGAATTLPIKQSDVDAAGPDIAKILAKAGLK